MAATSKKAEDRLRVLEAAVLKGDKSQTIFDEYEEKMVSLDVQIKVANERLNESFQHRVKKSIILFIIVNIV